MIEQIKEKFERCCEGCYFYLVDINGDIICSKCAIKEKDCPGIIYRIVKPRKRKSTK